MGKADLDAIVEDVVNVARLGEANARGWWGTQSFGAAGRVILQQRLPHTWRMAAVELDIAAAANRHNDVIDRPNAVHLFSDNWPVRRWASAWVAEQKTAEPADPYFEWLESVAVDDLLAELPAASSITVDGRATSVGSVARADFDSPEGLRAAVSSLAAVYAGLEGSFTVPYLEVE